MNNPVRSLTPLAIEFSDDELFLWKGSPTKSV